MTDQRWTRTRAQAWSSALPYLQGCNYVPSYAVNSLDMWAADRYDSQTIARELDWAAGLRMNTLRVFLHDLAYAADPDGFLARVDTFLELCAVRGIRPMFVLFDDCWDEPTPGPQPAPLPGIHNSRWTRSPGVTAAASSVERPRLEAYVRGVVRRFGRDERVLAWDVYNEVTNFFLRHLSRRQPLRTVALVATMVKRRLGTLPTLELARAACGWVRGEAPSQPLTLASWYSERWLNDELYALSDVISFHSYTDAASVAEEIAALRTHGRPILCTEWLSRPAGSRVETVLPVLRQHDVASYNWGLVDGATQTKYDWADAGGTVSGQPGEWFSDLLHPDGSPYREDEAATFRAGPPLY